MKRLTNLIILSVVTLAMTTEFSYGSCCWRRTKKRKADIISTDPNTITTSNTDLSTITTSNSTQNQEAKEIEADTDSQASKRPMLQQAKTPEQILQENGAIYGNKTANLMRLKMLSQETPSLGGYQVTVPPFCGITNVDVLTYLDRQTQGSSFAAEWKQFLASALYKGRMPATVHQEILANKKFPADFIEALKTFGQSIAQCFKNTTFTSPTLVDFISQAQGFQLMVRSTGKEDSDEFANAGGNESVANVTPTIDAISKAMGTVVASYIGEKSLKQRLAVATTVEHIAQILETPFVPVLVQCMIGEPTGGITPANEQELENIPVSGVLFTTEAEGGTPGVSHFQGTFGHNEGVVNNLVPVDTWYMTSDEKFYSIIRNKSSRLIPQIYTPLDYTPNTYTNGVSFGQQPALPSSALLAIKKLANRIEEHYQKPMDVELVVMPAETTIYLVQARPIIFGKKDPSYISDDVVKQCEKLQGVKFGIGTGAFCQINSVAELLIENSIGTACRKYLALPKINQDQIKCIIIKEKALDATTSHDATTLRATNKPIIQLDEHLQLRLDQWLEEQRISEQWFDENKSLIVVDAQRGCLLRSRQPLPAGAIVEEWGECPLPLKLSVNPSPEVPYPHVLQTKISTINDSEKQAWSQKTIHDLFRMLKTSTKDTIDQAHISLICILEKLYCELDQKGTAPDFNIIAPAISYQAYSIANTIIETLPKVQQRGSLELLYHVNFLQALFDQPTDANIINKYSLTTLGQPNVVPAKV